MLNMFQPGSVIAHNIYMLQTGQHFHFPEDLKPNNKKYKHSFIHLLYLFNYLFIVFL